MGTPSLLLTPTVLLSLLMSQLLLLHVLPILLPREFMVVFMLLPPQLSMVPGMELDMLLMLDLLLTLTELLSQLMSLQLLLLVLTTWLPTDTKLGLRTF